MKDFGYQHDKAALISSIRAQGMLVDSGLWNADLKNQKIRNSK
jgi:hypothetical protein